MGLFNKKYCDICGEKIGLLGNRKLEDGNLCKNCEKKLSPWFAGRRRSTVKQIRQQIAYREENRSKAESFNITQTIGRNAVKLYLDDGARRFTLSKGSDFAAENPDILDFSQALGCDLDIKESRRELGSHSAGRSGNGDPPQYEYSYDYKVTIRVDHPFFKEMSFNLNGRSVNTGTNRLSDRDLGAWSITRAGSVPHGLNSSNGFNEFIELGNELRTMIKGWKNATSADDGQTR